VPTPLTRTRLQGFGVSIRAAGWDEPVLADSVFTAEELQKLTIIGSASRLILEQERATNNYRRQFSTTDNPEDPGHLGKPIESYPGLASYRVTLDRVDLYDVNFMEAFGFPGINIVNQHKPLILFCTQAAPQKFQIDPITRLPIPGTGEDITMKPKGAEPTGTLKARSYAIIGCWIIDYPLNFDVFAEDQKFIQTLNLTATDFYVP
jgi:hypothetical protein